MNNSGIKFRLIVMNFLQFAIWGAYLTCMGTYLFNHNMGGQIGLFYSIQVLFRYLCRLSWV